ncbi:hypothetical protein [Kingella sp. (in: b-proteobacteria)]|nr:hypothetical protein [Kingella sp. (in: b-proteobacteria)]MDO4656414.1 hypothetical protein [Kingella sp. (in: b-proteobacteria)]
MDNSLARSFYDGRREQTSCPLYTQRQTENKSTPTNTPHNGAKAA